MNELFNIVACLLHSEACVIVPGLGGFVLNRQSAKVDAQTGRFCPPMSQVVFNTKLLHNDGLVCQAWAERRNCTLGEAGKQIALVVDGFKRSLAETGCVVVPEFGTFRLHASGCSFVSSLSQNGFSENYGLQEFYVPTLKNESKPLAMLRKYAGVGVAAAIATLLFVPFNSDEVYSNMASFMPVAPKTYKADVALDAVANSARQMQNAATLLTERTEKKSTAHAEARFYVVLKRFLNEADANAFVKKHQERLSDSLSIVTMSPNVFAVSCANTKDADMASKMMENVRKNSAFKETFILYK